MLHDSLLDSPVQWHLEDNRERNFLIVMLRFGIYGGGPMTYQELGEQFGLSVTRVRQIEANILRKWRWHGRAAPVKELIRLNRDMLWIKEEPVYWQGEWIDPRQWANEQGRKRLNK
jgi:DNA-binding CsgD family transcriptional regulator